MTNLLAFLILGALFALASARAGGRLLPAAKDFLPIAMREGYVDSTGSLQEESEDVSITEQLALSTSSVELQVYLGAFYMYKDPADEGESLKWFVRAAKQGNTVASLAAGLIHHHRGQSSSAKPFFQHASDSGETYGHYYLGRIMFEEASQSQQGPRAPELDEAASLFAMAVDVVDAQHSLAVMHEYGLLGEAGGDTESSADLAKILHEEAARRGSVDSLYHLALLYTFGRPAQDFHKAQLLFQRVIDHKPDHAPSLRYLGLFQAKGYGSDAPDYDAAIAYYEACAKAAGDEYPEVSSICVDEHDRLADVIQRVRKP